VPDLDTIWPGIMYFGMLVAAGVGAPIPEELPIVLAGGWIGSHPEFGLAGWLMLPVCIVGAVLCDGMLYGLGWWFGPRLLQNRFLKRLLPPERLVEIERNFHRHGIKVLLFTRMLPGIRSPIFITAGIMRMPFPRFLLGDLIYAIPGISLLFGLSYWFGAQFIELVEKFEHDVVDKLRPVLILAAIVGVGVYFIIHFYRRPVSTGDPKEVPLGETVAASMESVEKKLHLGEQESEVRSQRSGDLGSANSDQMFPVPGADEGIEKTRPASSDS